MSDEMDLDKIAEEELKHLEEVEKASASASPATSAPQTPKAAAKSGTATPPAPHRSIPVASNERRELVSFASFFLFLRVLVDLA